MNLNSVTLVGRLTRDPELKALPSSQHVCNFSLATSRSYERQGERREDTEYHNIVVYDIAAENCARYLRKGDICLVEGRLATRSWDKDGVKLYKTEIIAHRVQFGPKRNSEDVHAEAPDDVPTIDESSIPF